MNEDLQKRIETLETWKKNLERSSSIPLNIDQSFRERLLSGKMIFVTATMAFPSVNSVNSTALTISAPEVKIGDPCVACPGRIQDTGIFFTAYCAADGIVSVKFDNQTTGTVSPASDTFTIIVFSKNTR